MTKEEMLKKLEEGYKVRHQYFSPDEWMKRAETPGEIEFEDGCIVNEELFWFDRQDSIWDDDWKIVE